MRTSVLLATLIGLALLAAPAPAATAAPGNCITVIQGGDIGERFCVDEADCLVAEYRTTFLGTERYCIVPRPVESTSETSATDVQRCVATYAVSKYGSKYCVDSEGSCTVSEYRTTPFGTAYYCHLRRP